MRKKMLMKGKFGGLAALFILAVALIGISCSKEGGNSQTSELSYGDSILYLKNLSTDYIVYPTEQKTGQYFGFPDGIEIDPVTGAINVSKSESGLRYRITYVSPGGDSSTTMIVISGINFQDRFYHLSQGDSIALPIYNANVDRILPLNGSSFDEGNNANSGGCSVKTINGQINLAQTVRNGVFGTVPQNDAKQEFDIYYRLNDDSKKALNKIRVKVYYYATIDDVAPDLLQTLKDRGDEGVFLRLASTARNSSTAKVARPRPPCVIIIAN